MAASNAGTDMQAFREAALSCPIPLAVELIGEKWAFLILRGAFNGLQHFEQFQAGLGIARNILSDRLAKLVAGDIMERTPDPSDKRKVIYALTPKGEALLPVMLAVRQWGERWAYDGESPVVLAEGRTGKPIRPICVQSQDGRELKLSELIWISRDEMPRESDAA